MTIIDRAYAMQPLIGKGIKQVEVAARFGVNKSEVTRAKQILSLSRRLRAAIAAGEMSAESAILLYKRGRNNTEREAIYDAAVQRQKSIDEDNASTESNRKKRGRKEGSTHSKRQVVSSRAINEAAAIMEAAKNREQPDLPAHPSPLSLSVLPPSEYRSE